jgi:aspartate racemase
MVRNLTDGAPDRQARVFARLASRLQAAGADLVAVTSMGGHFCIRELISMSPLPILNLIPELDRALAARKLRRVGLLGTRLVMETRVYGGVPSVEVVLPRGERLQATHDAYVAMATVGQVTAAQREVFLASSRDLMDQGAEAVVLVGTDLFLAFDGLDCGFPLIDSAQVHVDALVRDSTGSP